MKLRWTLGIAAGLFLAAFSLYPQFKMFYLRGAEWNGHYAYNDIDEVAYASYLKALIDGRPRKNDPYTGRDDSPEHPQPESLFSIQFAGPYTIAIPARILGIDAPWAMTIAGAVAAFLTAVIIFWIVLMLTGDSVYALAGSLVVLAGGALFAGEGALGEITGWSYAYPYFPGFRRYIPAMAFPAFFLLVGSVYKIFVAEDQPRNLPAKWIAVAVACFAYTVFSYFYVWTTAAAFLGCFGLLYLAIRRDELKQSLLRFGVIGAGCAAALIPYAWLLSNRSHTMDDVQLLVRTRALDLQRMPELVAFAVLGILLISAAAGYIRLREGSAILTAALAMTVIVVFNQQVITGQSLQPIHYQVFIGNYVAGLAVVMLAGQFWKGWARRRTATLAAAAIAVVAAAWGFVECHYTVRVLDEVNIIRDEAYPVGRRLAELAKGDPAAKHQTVLHYGIAEADDLPTIAPQSVLWARHQHVFAGVTWDENKERYYQQLYYEGVRPEQLASGMKKGDDFVSMIALFGWGRHTDRLNSEYKPLTFGEIDAEAARYADYVASFDPSKPGVLPLDYLVVPSEYPVYLENVDRWYERDAGERFDKYLLYRLMRR